MVVQDLKHIIRYRSKGKRILFYLRKGSRATCELVASSKTVESPDDRLNAFLGCGEEDP